MSRLHIQPTHSLCGSNLTILPQSDYLVKVWPLDRLSAPIDTASLRNGDTLPLTLQYILSL